MKRPVVLALAVLVAAPARAQLAERNQVGVTTGHVHLLARNLDAQMPGTTVRVAFLTDPWGTRIELSEGLAPK
jgi:hypothetical protein